MNVHILQPFDTEKNLGRAYNRAMQLIGDDDYGCLCDMDTCFLTPDAGEILFNYAVQNGSAALLTCVTNRVSTLSVQQLYGGTVSNNTDIRFHIRLAEQQKRHLYKTTVIPGNISGMLMMISKKHWKENNFSEEGKCLGVDTEYATRLHEEGKVILLMNGLYIFHSYRLIKGICNKTHLI